MSRQRIDHDWLGLEQREEAPQRVQGKGRWAQLKQLQVRMSGEEVVGQPIDSVRRIEMAISVRVPSGGPIPVVPCPAIGQRGAAARHGDITHVRHEGIRLERVGADRGQQPDAHVVKSDHVVLDAVTSIDQAGRVVEIESRLVLHDQVADDLDPIGILEPHTEAAPPARLREHIVAQYNVRGIHDERRHVVTRELVALEQVVAAVHVVQAVAAVAHHVVPELQPVAEVDDHVPRPPHHVAVDQGIVTRPQSDTVSPHPQRPVLPHHRVADDPRSVALLEVDTEQHVTEPVVADHARIGRSEDAGVLLIEDPSRGTDVEPGDDGRRAQFHDRPLAAALEDRAPFPDEHHRYLDDDPLAVDPGGDPDGVTGPSSGQRRADRRDRLIRSHSQRLGREQENRQDRHRTVSRVVVRRRRHSRARATGPNAPATTINRAPAAGQLVTVKFATSVLPRNLGVNGSMRIGAVGERLCPYS